MAETTSDPHSLPTPGIHAMLPMSALGGSANMRVSKQGRRARVTPRCLRPSAAATQPREVAGHWSTASPLPERRTEVSVAADGSRLYLLGGYGPGAGGDAEEPRAVYAYDPDDDTWSELAPLPEGLNHAAAAVLEGNLYVIGGYRGSSFRGIDAVHVLGLSGGEWQVGPPLPTPRGALAAAVLDGRIHAIGGVDAEGRRSGAHEVFDPIEGRWSKAADLPTPRDHLAAAAVGGEIVVLAGRNAVSAVLTATEIYDAATDTWRTGAPVPTGRSGVAAAVLGARVYLFGGEMFDPRSTFDAAERYDPAADRWEVMPPMPTARHGLGAAALEGRIHVISGGPRAGLTFSNVHEVLEPAD